MLLRREQFQIKNISQMFELEEGYKDLKWAPKKNTVIERDTVFVASATKKGIKFK